MSSEWSYVNCVEKEVGFKAGWLTDFGVIHCNTFDHALKLLQNFSSSFDDRRGWSLSPFVSVIIPKEIM